MNEKITEHLGELLIFIKAGLLEGSAFVVKESPALIYEIIKYNIVRCSILIVLAIIISFCSLWLWGKIKKGNEKYKWVENDEAGILLFLLPLFGWILGGVIFFVNLLVLLKIILSPRLFLLESIRELIK